MPSMLETQDFFNFGPYRLDRKRRVLLRGEEIVPLTPKVIDTLMALVERAGQPVSKDELLRVVWPDTHVEESNLAQNISVLRKTLGRAPGNRPYVETIAKRGYRFVPDHSDPAGTLPPTPSFAIAQRRPITLFAAAVVMTVILGGGAGIWYLRRSA